MTFLLTHRDVILVVAGLALIVLLGAKSVGDRQRVRIVAAFDAEVQRDRAAGRQAGVVAMDALGRSANR